MHLDLLKKTLWVLDCLNEISEGPSTEHGDLDIGPNSSTSAGPSYGTRNGSQRPHGADTPKWDPNSDYSHAAQICVPPCCWDPVGCHTRCPYADESKTGSYHAARPHSFARTWEPSFIPAGRTCSRHRLYSTYRTLL